MVAMAAALARVGAGIEVKLTPLSVAVSLPPQPTRALAAARPGANGSSGTPARK